MKQNDKNKKQKKSIEWNSPEAILTMVEKVGRHREVLLKGKKVQYVDLLVLTSLDQLLFIFTSVIKQPTLMRRSTVLSIPSGLYYKSFTIINDDASVVSK
jgi:hypothetical protein